MKCTVLHASAGRLRVHMEQRHMTLEQADILEGYLRAVDGVTHVQVFDRTCDAVIRFSTSGQAVRAALAAFSYERAAGFAPERSGRALSREFEDKLFFTIARHYAFKLLLPTPLRTCISLYKGWGYLRSALRSLLKGRLDIAVLDGTAVTVSLLRGDFNTGSSVMFLLEIGEILEEWTHKKSVDDLARAMSLNVDKVWLHRDGREVLAPIAEVRVGDCVTVRTGGMIPLDGKVVGGEAMVNQASMTGESIPVHKTAGSYVYAGTAVEEGECVLCVDKALGGGRYDRIVQMIEQSEQLKSTTESRAAHLADRLVPYTLGGTLLTYLLTRNVTKALSVLMVDFSCALKLSMPITVLSAMREAGMHRISVKGGRFLEKMANADTIVLDKTGTLTYAAPRVARVVAFGGREEREMLRLAACLEEHYPHSIANAVVQAASVQGLSHEECHSKVEYIVAHGISSQVDGRKVVIGSDHFVFQDEGCRIPEGEQALFDALPDQYSHLYMAISGELAAVICIDDPLRSEAADVVAALKELGVGKIVMMTGDNERTACGVAAAVGVDEYHAGVLPEDKAAYVKAEREAGRTVVMIGDGVNDSPALSEADVGIAISDGAPIAREIADVTIQEEDLSELLTLKRLSDRLMDRINGHYRFIIGFNLALILLGVSGVLQPTLSALLHNISTVGVSLHGMKNLLE